jgi:hypothetical protein
MPSEREIVEMKNAVSELRSYLKDKGFRYEGLWYFRTTWMHKRILNNLERNGLVKKVGSIYDVAQKGIQFPNSSPEYDKRLGINNSIIYQVISNELNESIN